MTSEQDGEFIIPPEFNEQLLQLASSLPAEDWEKLLHGDPSKAQPLGIIQVDCRPMTREEWMNYRNGIKHSDLD